MSDPDASWNDVLRFFVEDDGAQQMLPFSVPLSAASRHSDQSAPLSTTATESVSRLVPQDSEGFAMPSAQQVGVTPQTFPSRSGEDAGHSATGRDINIPATSDSLYTHADELERLSDNRTLFRPLAPQYASPPISLQSEVQFHYPGFLADKLVRLESRSGDPSSIGVGVSTDRSDLLLPDTPTSSPSSEGAEDDSSSQEMGVASTHRAISAEASFKGKDEMKEDPPVSPEKPKGRLPRTKKPKRKRGPKFAIRTKCEVDIIDDGYKWRKYGQKAVKNSPFPRSYYKCTDKQCGVKKHVERQAEDASFVVTTYEGAHNHPSPASIPVIPRPIGNIPQVFPFSLPLRMGLFSVPQSNYDLLERVPDLEQEIFEPQRSQGLLEDVIPGELRRRSI